MELVTLAGHSNRYHPARFHLSFNVNRVFREIGVKTLIHSAVPPFVLMPKPHDETCGCA